MLQRSVTLDERRCKTIKRPSHRQARQIVGLSGIKDKKADGRGAIVTRDTTNERGSVVTVEIQRQHLFIQKNNTLINIFLPFKSPPKDQTCGPVRARVSRNERHSTGERNAEEAGAVTV